ncbi:hypothetical protein LOK46_32405 (plasmid) [Methylobacterium sp. NMS14P]|uniref:DUF6894 family protein n=1 Tax=Methylobacterium sp. NMS14P TaxID=2894310 RepID=UPI0023587C58|nr:hypothetical protein [Methylobacterium sp. NMS14P]WCS28895.1 hypothetical protein LOK46_32405 [Methylobacterium sp. NMS14P]
MSRYFISTAIGHEVQDEEGVELPSYDALRTILRHTLAAILHDEAEESGETDLTARAYDEDGRLVMQARASFSVTDQ